jgi:hypothetical protein
MSAAQPADPRRMSGCLTRGLTVALLIRIPGIDHDLAHQRRRKMASEAWDPLERNCQQDDVTKLRGFRRSAGGRAPSQFWMSGSKLSG